MIKQKISLLIGNILEWYDFALYGFFAHVFAQLFFPHLNKSMGILILPPISEDRHSGSMMATNIMPLGGLILWLNVGNGAARKRAELYLKE